MRRCLTITLGALACAALLAPTAQASVFTVTTTADEYNVNPGACALREAVEAANLGGSFGGCTATNADADIINLPAASYVLTSDLIDDTNVGGDLDVMNEQLSILGQNPNGPTTIDGDADDAGTTDDRVIEVHPSVGDGAGQDFGLTGLVIRNGSTTESGGGLYVNGPPGAMETFSVDIGLTTFTDNAAAQGGAIENEDGSLGVTESTISGNDASGSGGGISTTGADDAQTVLQNVTITGNRADTNVAGGGDGGGLVSILGNSLVRPVNSIVAGNSDLSPSTQAPDCAETLGGVLASVNYNLIGNTTGCDMPAATGDVRNVSAGLAPLALNPGAGLGTVLTHDLLSTSPARDAGSPAAPGSTFPACGTVSQNFKTRPLGAACDIGSFEATPNPPAGPGPGSKAKKCKKKKKKKGKSLAATAKKKKGCKKKKKKR